MTVDRELTVQNLAYAALDAVRAAVPVDLCAYLHVTEGDGPQLYLRAPDLSTMTAGEAFDVFGALRDALDRASGGDDVEAVRVGQFDAVAVRGRGRRSRGVFVVGRDDDPLTENESAIAERLCEAIASAAHAIEDATLPAASAGVDLTSVSVRMNDGVVAAEVAFTGGATGTASAVTTTDAVALATLDALSPERKLGEVTEGVVSGERVMIVLVRDEAGDAYIGTAIVGSDPVRAAAEATAATVR